MPFRPFVNFSRAFSKALGYRVALIARNPEKLKATADDIQKAGGEVRTRFITAQSVQDPYCAFSAGTSTILIVAAGHLSPPRSRTFQ